MQNTVISESFIHLSVLDSVKMSVLGMAVVFLMLAILIAVIWLMGKLRLGAPKETPPEKQAGKQAPAVCDDTLLLEGVDEPTAAMLMAIVADESGIPANELRFISIKEIG